MQKTAVVVDDSRVARIVLKRLLEAEQFDVVEFASAEEALAYLQDNSNPSIIFMDVMMAGMDGLTATKEIRANLGLKTVPVVICTGNSAELEQEKALASGANAVLTKPPQQDVVQAILASIATETTAADMEIDTNNTDQTTLTESDISSLEQKIVEKLRDDMHEVAEDVCQTIIEQQIDSYIQPHIEATLLPIKQQLHNQATVQQTVLDEQAVVHLIEQQLPQYIRNELATYDFGRQLESKMTTLTEELLKDYEQQQQFPEDIMQYIDNTIEQHSENTIKSQIEPLINRQIEQQLMTNNQTANENEITQQLTKQVTKLHRMLLVLAAIVFILAAVIIL